MRNTEHFDHVMSHMVDPSVDSIAAEMVLSSSATIEHSSAIHKLQIGLRGFWEIDRTITVMEMDEYSKFKLIMESKVSFPHPYTLYKKEWEYNLRDRNSMRMLQGDIFKFLQLVPTTEYMQKLVALLQQLEQINKSWFSNDAKVMLYNLETSSDRPNWRFKITSANEQTIYADYLSPEAADGHTYAMFLRSARAAEKRGKIEGIMHILKRQAAAATLEAFTGTGFELYELPQEIQKILKNQ